jgi:hypothetical protein
MDTELDSKGVVLGRLLDSIFTSIFLFLATVGVSLNTFFQHSKFPSISYGISSDPIHQGERVTQEKRSRYVGPEKGLKTDTTHPCGMASVRHLYWSPSSFPHMPIFLISMCGFITMNWIFSLDMITLRISRIGS